MCGDAGVDAHHIMERRLFPNGGYYVENGATVCSKCHLLAESTEISCDDLRKKIGITDVILPPHLYKDEKYDKWGNQYLANGQRLRGELFDDESVQKILANKHNFTKYIKYPRTYHLHNSNPSKDDRVQHNLEEFIGKRVIVTEKMDGENTTMYGDHIHARSIDSDSHASRSWVKNFHASYVAYNIDEGWRICGENMYAKHAIPYDNLDSYFLGFSVWNSSNECLSWDDTKEYFEILGVSHVPELYDGEWNKDLMYDFVPSDTDKQEGFTIRLAESFHYGKFRDSIVKWVRPNHVQTTHNWKREVMVKNRLRKERK